MCVTISIDWSDCNPDVGKGFRCEGQPNTIRISHGGSYIRLSPSTIWKAAVTAAEHGMKESALDADSARTIIKFLEG